MKKHPVRSWVAIPLAASVTWANVSAQTTNSSEDEEIFELSPFTVTSDGDDGYRATSTTAGSRLNTQLKDVAASVSVLTDAFMDDLGAIDVATALSMVAGVETDVTSDVTAINLGSGYLGGDFNNVNASEGTIRVRGLGSATNAANYLEAFGPLDRYNMERVEFLRGANALLFGLGEPGGVVNYTTKKAFMAKDKNEVEFQLDNFGTRRLKVDFSRALIEDKLAVRFAGVANDRRYRVKTAGETDNRAYFTIGYKPFESTRLDAYVEDVHLQGRRPNYRLPQDNTSAWLREYNRAHADAAANGGLVNILDIDGNPTGATKPLQQYLDDNLVYDSSWSATSNGNSGPSPDIPIASRVATDENGNFLVNEGNYRRFMDTRNNGFTGYYTPENGWDSPLGGQFTSYGTLLPNLSAGNNNNPRAQLRFHRSSFGNDAAPGEGAFVDPQVTDEGIFPFLDYEIGALPGNEREVKNQKFGFNLEQKIVEDLFFNLSYLKENYTAEQTFAPLAQAQAVSIDINKYLPGSIPNPSLLTGANGLPVRTNLTLEAAVALAQTNVSNGIQVANNQAFLEQILIDPSLPFTPENDARTPNPNYLRPFFHGRTIGSYRNIESEGFLAQLNYDFDFSEKSDKLGFLGNHRLTGFMSGNSNQTHTYRASGYADYNPGAFEGSTENIPSGRWFVPIWYIGDAVEPGDTALRISDLPDTTVPNLGDSLPYYGFTATNATGASPRGSWQVAPNPVTWRQYVIGNSAELTSIDAGAWGTSLQSFFWNNRIVATLGYRKDTVQNDSFFLTNPVDATQIDFDSGIGGSGSRIDEFDLSAPSVLNRTTVALRTNSLVFHATPWLRFFYNESENFALTRPTTDSFGRPNPPASGLTEEYGFGMSLFEDKLDLKFNFYDTRQKDQLGTGAAIRLEQRIPNFENDVLDVIKEQDLARQRGEATAFTIADWQEIRLIDGVLTTVNPALGTGQQLVVDGVPQTNPDGSPTIEYTYEYERLNNLGVTRDSVSEGWELSATYNPNKNLRISANVSRLENELTNIERQSIEYVGLRSEYWQQFFDRGFHTNGDSDSTVYGPDETPAPDSNLLVTNLYNRFGTELLDAIRSEGTSGPGISEYNARLTANYSFREGMLKGFSVGTNLRWESGKIFGYNLIVRDADSLPEGFPTTDINRNGVLDEGEIIIVQDDFNNPLESDAIVTGGMSFAYRGKLHGDKVNWRIQLNVDNLFKQGDDLRPIRLRPDETIVYGINVPTTFKLTNSFDF
ncbi:TonB-dependent receptor plug domain-containing protein [Pelagicoccus enzymogenes]|uniref:TonB-dependent receptor plug domain-containing protein n=1 Tax=Pelagicoccus enzymogenes TaxID=2773457 RepID=UPI00280D45B2|nr:TonB-dependent receptor plug domain-containing protein [Pelagicoccus enzymogenes]MDQ8198601.1 TonB-dependent receptor plug domain-containing protein [Pelagicoccus enzymogenes]